MFKCERATPEGDTLVRTFETYQEARRFVMREGDNSRLWSIEPKSWLSADDLEALRHVEAHGFPNA